MSRMGDGGWGGSMRRIFGESDNPLAWSLPLYTAWGIRVRIHLAFVLYAVLKLLWGATADGVGFTLTLIAMTALFLLVLLHEYGHCFASRAVGGEATDILMWPLGGLATVQPPHHWRAHLITTLAGPGVNLVLWPVFAIALLGLGVSGQALVFNPLAPGAAMAETAGSYLTLSIWLFYYINLILLGFNMLVPMYPMDGGRTVQAILWAKMGEEPSMRIAASIGLGAAMVLGVLAIVANELIVLVIAALGGIYCWQERKRLKYGDPALGGVGGPQIDLSAAYDNSRAEAAPEKPSRRERRQQEEDEALEVEVDRILQKINEQGRDSLTRGERRTLQQATERRRQG